MAEASPGPRERQRGPSADARRMSELLRDLAAGEGPERISVGDVLGRLSGRSFGALILIFALPGLVPGPPGIGGIFGLLILFLGLQMAAGYDRPWLPRTITRRSITRADLQRMLARALPVLSKLERLCRPRLCGVTAGTAKRMIGLMVMVLGAALVVPVPLTNFLPAAAMVVLAVGFVERDGVVVLIGLVAGAVACAVVLGAGLSLIAGALMLTGGTGE